MFLLFYFISYFILFYLILYYSIFFIFLANSDVQRYIIRKLTDIGFKISSIEEQEILLNNKLDIILRKLEKYFSREEIIEKEIAEQCLMDNFPIDNIEDLEKLEKSFIDDTANRKELVNVNVIKNLTSS